MRRQAGYTLLELLVILVIMLLLFSAIPGMALQVITKIRFSGEVAEIEAQLAVDHQKAIYTGQTVSVSADNLEHNGRIKLIILPYKVITFFPDGSSSADIVRIEQSGRFRVLVVDPVDGLCRDN